MLARIERQIGKRLPRLHLNDFDYTVKQAPARASAGKLYGGKPTGARHRRETAMAVGNGPRKPSRGQGRR